ncbi:MAG: glycosyltransferase family 9 protein [Acidobacteria bacterium]|nr:glycosyltransferase family 9 protein [Acidobacteriota bacterium]MBI3658043.1 glycosyltransferase family 9 protein [Acidobacteriota bacterium]
MEPPQPPRSLIVLPNRGTAETILLIPALEMLIRTMPYAQVSIAATNYEQEEALQLSTISAPICTLNGWTWWHDFGWLRKPCKTLRSIRHNWRVMREFDHVVFLEAERLAPKAWIRIASWVRARVLVHSIEEGYLTMNRCAYYQRAVAKLLNVNAAPPGHVPSLSPSAEDQKFAEAFFQRSVPARQPVIYVNPFVPHGSENRRWPIDRYAALAAALVRRGGYLLLHNPNGADVRLAAQITDRLFAHVQILPPLKLGQTGALLARCALYIGNDTAFVHVALGVATPTLTIFGPTSDEIFAGYNPLQRVIKNLSACPVAEGSSARACPGCKRFETSLAWDKREDQLPYPCLNPITPSAVLSLAEEMLSWKSNTRGRTDRF